MLVPIIAVAGLICLSSLLAYKTAEHFLKKLYGEPLFDSSYYLQDLATYASFSAIFASTYFSGSVLLSPYTTNVFVLCAILSAAYYVTFRGILLALFSNRFRSILQKRYGFTERVIFDGAISRYQGGGVPSYVAGHLQTQMRVSCKVAIPIGLVWVIFIFVGLQYIPIQWVEGLVTSGLLALYSSIISTIILLPSNDDVSVPKWKAHPASCAIPVILFLGLFVFLTPITCSNVSASPSP